MGYYDSGDTRKMIHSSEDDEGYENQTANTRMSFGLLNVSDIINQRYFPISISREIKLPISDDTDRQFWAEDELSNSESRQYLNNKKRKRRHSVSYRNRITIHRSRSLLLQSSNSSLDSISNQVSPGTSRQKRFSNRQNVKQQTEYRNAKKRSSQEKGTLFPLNDRSVHGRSKNYNKKRLQKH